MSGGPYAPPERDAASGRMRASGIRWDAVAAIIASLVGLLALLVAGYTAYIQRQQVRAQVWPYLLMGKSNVNGHYELEAFNKGVGPVIVQSVQVSIGLQPVASWKDLERRIGFKPVGESVQSTLNGRVLAPGEQLNWIAFQNASDVDAFVEDWEKFRVEARVCYSSTLGESWLTTYHGGPLERPLPVSHCPKLPQSVQFSD
ncbi:MAG TPA: hypothetical protein VN693_05500 [Rhodanobacteraceae bacterium]|nr:hypothetical protein [Rhodanobacteraceae bacterium]